MDSDVALLLTDIVRSVDTWLRFPAHMPAAIDQHHSILRDTIRAHGGHDFNDTGDGLWMLCPDPVAAVHGAVEMQRRLMRAEYPGPVPTLWVRMGMHVGTPTPREDNYCGEPVNLNARVAAAAHGGQIIVTGALAEAVEGRLDDGIGLLYLGSYRFRHFPDPVDIHQVTHPDLRATFPKLKTDVDDTDPLPSPGTSFVGREREITDLGDVLEAQSLLTLTGPPGVGKTRLAIELANQVLNRYTLGARLIERSTTGASGQVAAVATELGISRGLALGSTETAGDGSLEDLVVAVLTGTSVILVLDGFGRADTEMMRLIGRIVHECPTSRIIVTSAQPLGRSGEQVWSVRPLPVADQDAPASETTAAERLFVDRARLADGRFDATASREAVRAVCRAVDGVPLAIELLASRVSIRSANELVDETEHLLDLGEGVSLRDVLASSIDRIPDDAARAFAELSVFQGWFRRWMAVQVCPGFESSAETQQILDLLTSRSLLEHRSDGIDTYYRLLGPIRALAQERAADAGLDDELARLHAEAHLVEAETASERVRGMDEPAWIARLENDLPDLHLALDWLLDHDRVNDAVRLLVAVWPHAYTRMWEPFWDWVVDTIMRIDTGATPELFGVAAVGAWRRGEGDRAIDLAEHAIALEAELGIGPTIPARLALLDSMGAGNSTQRDPVEVATQLFFAAEATGEPYWIVNSYVIAAYGLASMGSVEDAIRYGEAGLRRARDGANPTTRAWALFGAGIAYEASDEPYAEALLDESVRLARTVGSRWVESISLSVLGVMRRRLEGGRAAAPILLDLIELWAGFPALQWRTLLESGLALLDAGDAENGLTLISAAEDTGAVQLCLPTEQQLAASAALRAEDSLGPRDTLRAVARGRVGPRSEMVELTRSALTDLINPPGRPDDRRSVG